MSTFLGLNKMLNEYLFQIAIGLCTILGTLGLWILSGIQRNLNTLTENVQDLTIKLTELVVKQRSNQEALAALASDFKKCKESHPCLTIAKPKRLKVRS